MNRLDKIESLAKEILFEVDQIRNESSKDDIYNVSISHKNGLVHLTWDTNVNKEMTWLYYFTGFDKNGNPINKEWQHSSAHYRKKPGYTSDAADKIPVRLDGLWRFKAVVGEWIPEKKDGEVIGGTIDKEWESDIFEIETEVESPKNFNVSK